jgi:glucose dehydrogenase
MSDQSPPRVLGVLLAVLGAALALGGFKILQQGGGAYFLVVGIGILVSGVLVARGKMLGAKVYAATFAIIVLWSFAEIGPVFGALVPRILVPALICWYLFSSRVRERLA